MWEDNNGNGVEGKQRNMNHLPVIKLIEDRRGVGLSRPDQWACLDRCRIEDYRLLPLSLCPYPPAHLQDHFRCGRPGVP